MPTREFYNEQIEKEFAAAREAREVGNDGRMRVCARRAAGLAIRWFLSKHERDGWGSDALRQLQHLKEDEFFPQEVRDAAMRLITKVSDKFTYAFATDPVEDATLIVRYIESVMNS